MQNILFLDIEKNPRNNEVDYGATFMGKELHERNSNKLEHWIRESKYICGHNILNHDIPELKKKLGNQIFHEKKFIDTLLWSPLLFVKRPNHKLTKGYRIVNASEVNNPLSDCKLTEDYLIQELNRFNGLSIEEKSFYYSLLKNEPSFNVLFEFAGFDSSKSIDLSVGELFGNTICSNIDLAYFQTEFPIELAYVFTLLKLGDEDAVLPPWVRYEYPEAENILNTLRFESCENKDCHY
jgi:ATP-dependent DNA helicase RecQ